MAEVFSPQRSYLFLVVSFLMLVLLTIFLFSYYHVALTGKASASLVVNNPISGSPFTGTFLYDLSSGGTLPQDTLVELSVNKYKKQLPLLKTVGKNYDKNVRFVEFNPLIDVTFVLEPLVSHSGSSDASSLPIEGSSDAQGDANQNVGPGESSASMGGTQSVSGGSGAGTTSFTGAIVAEPEKLVTVSVRAGREVYYTIPSSKKARIVEVRRSRDHFLLTSSSADLSQQGTTVTVQSRYLEQVQGFSAQTGVDHVEIALESFHFIPRKGRADVEVALIYKGDTFASAKESFVIPAGGVGSTSSGEGAESATDATLAGGVRRIPSLIAAPAKAACERVVCGSFGSCSVPSLAQTVQKGTSSLPLVQSRSCMCELTGEAFTETRPCELSSSTVSGELDAVPTILASSSNTRDSNARPHETHSDSISWKESYDETFDLRTLGSVSRELPVATRMVFDLGTGSHSVGLESISNGRAGVVVSSVPQYASLATGEFSYFDLDGDHLDDIRVSAVSVRKSSALINVAPLEGPNLSPLLGEGERGVTLFKRDSTTPIAHILVNEQSPAVRLFLVQSAIRMPPHCYNTIQDSRETGVDCGADCMVCKKESPRYFFIGFWIAVILLLLTLWGVLRN